MKMIVIILIEIQLNKQEKREIIHYEKSFLFHLLQIKFPVSYFSSFFLLSYSLIYYLMKLSRKHKETKRK